MSSSLWVSAFPGNVPRNQLDGLPLQNAQQYTNPADGAQTLVYAGHVVKYWPPGVDAVGGTRILDATPILFDTKYQLTTPFLDFTPCTMFVFIISRLMLAGAAAVAAKPLYLCAQYKSPHRSSVDGYEPEVSMSIGGVINDAYNAIYPLQSAPITFPAQADPGFNVVQQFTVCIGTGSGVGSGSSLIPLVMGNAVRIQLNWLTVAPAVNDGSLYTLEILGSTN